MTYWERVTMKPREFYDSEADYLDALDRAHEYDRQAEAASDFADDAEPVKVVAK